MFVVVVQAADDRSAFDLQQAFGPFKYKREAFAWARHDCFVGLKELNAGENLTDKEIKELIYEDAETVGYEGGTTWVIQEVTPVKSQKRLNKNVPTLRTIFKDEGADPALSVAKKLGFTKVQALELFKAWV